MLLYTMRRPNPSRYEREGLSRSSFRGLGYGVSAEDFRYIVQEMRYLEELGWGEITSDEYEVTYSLFSFKRPYELSMHAYFRPLPSNRPIRLRPEGRMGPGIPYFRVELEVLRKTASKKQDLVKFVQYEGSDGHEALRTYTKTYLRLFAEGIDLTKEAYNRWLGERNF